MKAPEAPKPVDFSELFPARFFKAGDLRGQRVTLQISSVDVEPTVGRSGEKRTRAVLTFAGAPKQLELNRTNGLCVRAMFGRNLAGWVGKRVTLGPEERRGSWFVRVIGSPDIAKDMEVSIDLQRGESFTLALHAIAETAFGSFEEQTR